MVVNQWYQRQIQALLGAAGGMFGPIASGLAGLGGAVTQITSRTTAVTLNKLCGSITLVSAAGSTAAASFTVNNSKVNAGDVVMICQKSGTDKYSVGASAVADGSFQITSQTRSGTTTEQPVFNFIVFKATAS